MPGGVGGARSNAAPIPIFVTGPAFHGQGSANHVADSCPDAGLFVNPHFVPVGDRSATTAASQSHSVCPAGNCRSSVGPANYANRRECSNRHPIRVIRVIRGQTLLLFHWTAMQPRRRSDVPSAGPVIVVACNVPSKEEPTKKKGQALSPFFCHQSLCLPKRIAGWLRFPRSFAPLRVWFCCLAT